RHNDLNHLEKRLIETSAKGCRYICVESVYSTDGSIAPLKDFCALAKRYRAQLIIDEAHAVGVIGPEGKGLISALELEKEIFAMVATFGKGPGTYGAIVLGSVILKEFLINFARPVIYTTALPFYNLTGIECSYALFPNLENERRHIHKLIKIFRNAYPEASMTHIQSIKVKGNQQAIEASQHLAEKGFDVRALLSPTVRRGQERLRVCLHAFNTEEEVKALLTGMD
ncbi:MAG: pyridoxal phosphate-dependent aminotransferase family protein, partial [Parachlamydiaceae bacterium]|nr:pyridoxal phosphate-dependent aminotransferase family protein [Parachlamydiaceae bacterium]